LLASNIIYFRFNFIAFYKVDIISLDS